MNIRVQIMPAALKLQNFFLELNLAVYGADLIGMISERTGESCIKLLHKGRIVSSDKSLAEQGVVNDSKIIVTRDTSKQPTTLPATSKLNPAHNLLPASNLSTSPSHPVQPPSKIPDPVPSSPPKKLKSESITMHESSIPNVFAWGSNTSGKLGTGNKLDWLVPCPCLFPESTIIKQVSCGASLTVGLSDLGQLYIWGKRVYPQDSNPNFKNEDRPCHITELSSIRFCKVAAGNNHALALDCRGDVWSWGDGSLGQLGHASQINEFYPKRIEKLQGFRVKDIDAGAVHSAAVTTSRKCLAWGSNTAKQVQVFRENPVVEPCAVLGVSADSVRCADLYTLWQDEGKIWMTGNKQDVKFVCEGLNVIDAGGEKSYLTNDRGDFYEFDGIEVKELEKILNLKQVSTNGSDLLVVTSDGLLMAKGSNKHGELGIGNKVQSQDWVAVGINVEIDSVSCGTSHVVAVAKPNDLASCLFNERFPSDAQVFCLNGQIEVNTMMLNSHTQVNTLFENTFAGFKSELSVKATNAVVRWLYSKKLSLDLEIDELESIHQFALRKNSKNLAILCKSEIDIKIGGINYLLAFPIESINGEIGSMEQAEIKLREERKQVKKEEIKNEE